MPTLEFKGKPFVHAHHLSVPFRELVIDADKSLPGADGPSLDDNLIVHGDNLEALKALLPKYAGKVDCIFIDPPYNTGKEGWAYNDNVNSPLMKAWLGKTVDGEDLERHDKWACMMWPRLMLLRELLSQDGLIAVCIGNHEQHSLKLIIEEIFGRSSFVTTLAWKSRAKPSNTGGAATKPQNDAEYIHLYKKSVDPTLNAVISGRVRSYPHVDQDGKFRLQTILKSGRGENRRETMRFSIHGYTPPEGQRWQAGEANTRKLFSTNRAGLFEGTPFLKYYEHEEKDEASPFYCYVPREESGTAEGGKNLLNDIMGNDHGFDTVKPLEIIEYVLTRVTKQYSIILDSFAGSGTTAHAVLAANAKDGGDRKFILIETEDYADTLTAERVRRVAEGFVFEGSQKTELLRENLTWAKLNNADALLAKVASFDALDAHRFDRIEKTVKDGELIVTGVTECKKTAPGLGGSFTYCDLGEPMDMARFFDGATPPALEQVARYVAYTATGATLDVVTDGVNHLVGEAGGYRLHLIYRANADFMRSDAAMLDMATAERIATAGAVSGKPILVFAAGKYMGQKQLSAMGLTFAQLPYAIHRMLPGDGDGE